MIDFSKMYCNFHPHELITNFCNKDECLIGLCANCICTHTQSHVQKGTTPDYQNIRMTYKKVQDNIRSQVQLFQKDKQRIEKIAEQVNEKRMKVKEVIQATKQQVSVLLGTFFQEKEKKMLTQIEAEQKKYGLHCTPRLQSLNSYISRQVTNLIAAAQQMSSKNFLQSLPRIRTQCLVNSQKLHNDIQSQIIDNQRFQTAISFNKPLLNSLSQLMEKMISVGFNNSQLQNFRKRRQSQIQKRPLSQGKVMERNFSQQLIQPSFSPSINNRNIQSQININGQGGTMRGPNTMLRNPGPVYKSSYLSEVPGFSQNFNDISKIQNKQNFNKTSTNFIQDPRTFNPNVQSQNQFYSNLPMNSLPFVPNNPLLFQQRELTKREPEIISGRVGQKTFPSANQNSPVQPFYVNQRIMTQTNGQQKSGSDGFNRKPKKSGLKVITTNDIESQFLKNLEQQKSKSSMIQYF